MNLNARDRLILIGVLVVLIWVLGVVTLIKPAIDDVKKANNELNQKTVELDNLKKQIEEDKDLPKQIDKAYGEATEIADVFYPKMAHYETMTEIQNQFDVNDDGEQDINNLNLYITELSSLELNRYVFAPEDTNTQLDNIVTNAQEATAEEGGDVEVLNIELSDYSVNFDFKAKKQDLLKFIQNIQSNPHRSLVVSELEVLDVGENKEDTEFEGSMTLDFIMVPELEDPAVINEQVAEKVKAIEAK